MFRIFKWKVQVETKSKWKPGDILWKHIRMEIKNNQ